MPDQDTVSSTSQNFLDIYDVIDDVLILKNGSCSMILTVNAMNFGLLAEQEQDAVIYAYAGLLNSLNFPIQIVIQSQTKDASAYLSLLKERGEETTEPIKKSWISRYSQFVSDLIQERNVLDKKFFVVIPASSLEMGLTTVQNIVSGFKEQSIEGVEKSVILEKAKTLLEPKLDHIISQFNRIGLSARQLTTQEIIRLFYTNYNPEATEGQQITNSASYTTALVQAQVRGDFMTNQPPQNQVDPTQPIAPTTSAPVTPAVLVDPTAPITPVAPLDSTAPITPVAPPVEEINLVESPIIQPPSATSPAVIPPTMAPPSVPTTMEITQPESKTTSRVFAPTSTQPLAPLAQPLTPPAQPSAQPLAPLTDKDPADQVEKTIQANINNALEEIS